MSVGQSEFVHSDQTVTAFSEPAVGFCQWFFQHHDKKKRNFWDKTGTPALALLQLGWNVSDILIQVFISPCFLGDLTDSTSGLCQDILPSPFQSPFPVVFAAMAKLPSGSTQARYNMGTWAEILFSGWFSPLRIKHLSGRKALSSHRGKGPG